VHDIPEFAPVNLAGACRHGSLSHGTCQVVVVYASPGLLQPLAFQPYSTGTFVELVLVVRDEVARLRPRPARIGDARYHLVDVHAHFRSFGFFRRSPYRDVTYLVPSSNSTAALFFPPTANNRHRSPFRPPGDHSSSFVGRLSQAHQYERVFRSLIDPSYPL